MRTCFLARTPKRACVFSYLSLCFCWMGCYVGDVFFSCFSCCFVFFSAQENTWNKNACVCCFQIKGSSKNSYAYSFRSKETYMCFGVWTPQKKMYVCVLPQSFKGRKNDFPQLWTLKKELCMHFRTPRCCSLFPVMATPEETFVQCLPWTHPSSNFS